MLELKEPMVESPRHSASSLPGPKPDPAVSAVITGIGYGRPRLEQLDDTQFFHPSHLGNSDDPLVSPLDRDPNYPLCSLLLNRPCGGLLSLARDLRLSAYLVYQK